MGFAKFNICSPCCNYTFVCNPYTVVNITNPANNSSPSPTPSDLWGELLFLYSDGRLGCNQQTSMYPSGGRLESVGVYPSSIIPCTIPIEMFFGTNHTTSIFIENYANGTLIDLNTQLRKTTSDSRQRFDVQRDPSASAVCCNSLVGSPVKATCNCYEVPNNSSSAWGTIYYQVYPNRFFLGCATGQYPYHHEYTDCSQSFYFCSADICNGSGVDKHQTINIPYCLTTLEAELATQPGVSIPLDRGVPYILAFYDSAIGVCNSSTPYYNQSVAVSSPCYNVTGVVYQWFYKADIHNSGCNNFYVNAGTTTRAIFDWSPIQGVGAPNHRCDNTTRYIVFDCADTDINFCGVGHVSPTVLSDKTGYGVPTYRCTVANSCPGCVPDRLGVTSSNNKTTIAIQPYTCQVTVEYPNSAGNLRYAGELVLDNIAWGSPGGCFAWVPNPQTQSCGSTPYDTSFSALVAATVVGVTFHGYQGSRICYPGIGCTWATSCYANDINYGLIRAEAVDMNTFCAGSNHPIVYFNNFSRYYPTDVQNGYIECCDPADGTPNGTITANSTDCAPPLSTVSYRAASPGQLWVTKSCCEHYQRYLNSFQYLGWAGYCTLFGVPQCLKDLQPTFYGPESYSLTNDICNDVVSCSVYDVDGNLFYTVTI